VKVLRLAYHDVLNRSQEISQKLSDFLGIPLNVGAMMKQVDASLYRNRTA
jgi:hypothetical protein